VELFPDTATVVDGELRIGGCDVVDLAAHFGTPLYVYDEVSIVSRAKAFKSALEGAYSGRTLVCYASKAYSAPWLLRLLRDEGLGLDVASDGELFVAVKSGFPKDRIYLHGNNKSEDELRHALSEQVSRIVIDNVEEAALLGRLAKEARVTQAVLLRVSPSVDAHTHEHLKTGRLDTKFGLGIESGVAEHGVVEILKWPSLDLRGYHMHIGSQIHELEPYEAAITRLFAFAQEMKTKHGVLLREVSPGGGFGVRYTMKDPATKPEDTIRNVADLISTAARNARVDPLPGLSVEPGRALVAQAGVALYRVGYVKKIPAGRTYVAIDGGMADNIRPTAYGAGYTAVLANRMEDKTAVTDVAIAGKYCETGDVLIQHVDLPLPRAGDLLAIPNSGAYQLSMASNYNMALRPAVVVAANGNARLVRRRETYQDIIASEVMSSDRPASATPDSARPHRA
jgi:diaminopimelate decarboxylase